ncbi:hypothetical protein [Microbacterium sp. SORGH_AS_0888]|uniref:hypothetical protein n=1 Tax=Microbacterium sp. SORGH_AS_0888 TaxID=3041791 RepID=UPI0027874154|nr:hypothetical protein [Microbacterium sp. SORGH_AS_0888]MDQ1129571.1 putative Tic20 family protein [Microbacterium sp. SORGH_AS_0888]
MTQPDAPWTTPVGGGAPLPGPPVAGAPGYPPAVPTGRVAWALGFLAYIPVPAVGVVIAAFAMLLAYRSQQRRGPLAAENARNAANWALTLLGVFVLCGLWVLVWALAGATHGFFPIGAAVIVYFLLALTHAVVTIVGTVVSGSRVFRCPIAVPFLRRR